jgi:hypothetical protein
MEIGRFFFAAPETLGDASRVDARADVYGPGMTLAFALYGRELTVECLLEREAFLSGLQCSEALKSVMRKAVNTQVGVRYPDIRAMRETLGKVSRSMHSGALNRALSWMSSRSLGVLRSGRHSSAKGPRHSRTALAVVTVGGLLLVVGGGFAQFGMRAGLGATGDVASGEVRAVETATSQIPEEPSPKVVSVQVADAPLSASTVNDPSTRATAPVPPASALVTAPVAEKTSTRSPPRPRPRALALNATLEFRIRPYAVVTLDGKVLGQTPLAAVEVPVGKHTLRLVNKELGKDVTKSIEVKADRPNVFKLNLEAE